MLKKFYGTETVRLAVFSLLAVALFAGIALFGGTEVSANHPVLVEGNCDSPIPGTTQLPVIAATPSGVNSAGICGDFDGDGRIGTAEDTDGADRIFGTLRAAIGPGTGAAAGTGANFNGRITIVASGRFAETLFIGNSGFIVGEGTANPGNTTIEAAPGVEANLDAILQGDPAGGNVARTGATGITIFLTGTDRVTTLRNLVIRNWLNGISTSLNSRVHIDNCRLEGNVGFGIRVTDNSRVVISHTQVDSSGFRTGVGVATPSPGTGISVEGTAQARIDFTNISHSFAAGINNTTGSANNVMLYGVTTYFNNPNIGGSGAIVAPNPNYAN